jgi:hypothetical protein
MISAADSAEMAYARPEPVRMTAMEEATADCGKNREM